jgi:hypothetical protein
MPNELIPHHTVTFWLCKVDWCLKRGFSSAQYSLRWKWASSDVIKFGRNCGSVSIVSNSLLQKFLRIFKSRSNIYCTIWILNGWKCKSMCNILLTLLADMPSVTEYRLAERRGLCCGPTRTLRTDRRRPGFFFGKVEAVHINWLTQF